MAVKVANALGGRAVRAREVRTGDQLISPRDGQRRIVVQVSERDGRWVSIHHGANACTLAPPMAWVRIVRRSRTVNYDAPETVHTTSSAVPSQRKGGR